MPVAADDSEVVDGEAQCVGDGNDLKRPAADIRSAAEAKLIALACSPAPEGFARWSLRLLEEKVVELNIVDKASDNTIGRTLKKTPSNRTAIGSG